MKGVSIKIDLVAQVFGDDSAGRVEFKDVNCSSNIAVENGGCFHNSGAGAITNGTSMQDNVSYNGGGVCECKTGN